jgi:hypothetical protein
LITVLSPADAATFGVPYFLDQKIHDNLIIAQDNASANFKEMAAMRFRGEYGSTENYFIGDCAYIDTTTGGKTKRTEYIYYPASTSDYHPGKSSGLNLGFPIMNVDPATHNPDPWVIRSVCFLDADYVNGAYDGSKYYVRTS